VEGYLAKIRGDRLLGFAVTKQERMSGDAAAGRVLRAGFRCWPGPGILLPPVASACAATYPGSGTVVLDFAVAHLPQVVPFLLGD